MKKNKGFTLVELLAVIVILAIVALIVVPVVMNVIKDARKKSAIESFRGYMDAVEKTIIRDSMKTTSELPSKDSNGCYNLNSLNPKIKIKGDKPVIDDDDDKLCVQNGKITSVSEVSMHGYALEYKEGKVLFNGKYVEDTTIPEITLGSITATKNSITIPYEVATGTSGVTVTCEYGTSESYGNQGTIEDNKCILSGLNSQTKYYFRINSRTGKKKTASQASSKETLCGDYTANQVVASYTSYGANTVQLKCKGTYKLEVWGASGGFDYGNSSSFVNSGKGGYSIGAYTTSIINKNVYVYVGGRPTGTGVGGYNGGGATAYNTSCSQGGGGGATHIAAGSTNRGVLANYNSYRSEVLIVAGGGGSGGTTSNYHFGGSGGGYHGGDNIYSGSTTNTYSGKGGTQSAGGSRCTNSNCTSSVTINSYSGPTTTSGSFGQGGIGLGCNGGAGGAGYFGGGGGYASGGGGGGSGYIGGVTSNSTYGIIKQMYMFNNGYQTYASSSDDDNKTTMTTSTCSGSTLTANAAREGNGAARITYLGK